MLDFSGQSLWLIWWVPGWLLKPGLLYAMAKAHLPRFWLWLLLGFILWCDFQYQAPLLCFWAGILAVLAVWLVWRHLQQVYAGAIQPAFLIAAGLIMAFTFCLSREIGFCLTVGLAGFSILHCFLHEREEKGIAYSQVSNRAVAKRWLGLWGLYWLLPLCVFYGVLNVLNTGLGLNWDFAAACRADDRSIQWPLGYFSSFHQEFGNALKPLLKGPVQFYGLQIGFCLADAVWLTLIGILPIVGILGMGYQLPGRFVYRLLQKPDEELLLFWLGGTAMILATLIHSTAAQIVAHGALAFLLGFVVWCRWLQRRSSAERVFRRLALILLLLLVIGHFF